MNEISEAKILWDNCKFNGIDITKFYEFTGEAIAQKLIDRFGAAKSFSLVCGLGGNGTDGLAIANALSKKSQNRVNLFLIGRPSHIDNPVGVELWEKIKINKNIDAKQECYAKDLKRTDIILEALVGTGMEGKVLNKRFRDVVKKIAHFDSKLISVDNPTPHYKPDLIYSILYPKDEASEVISFTLPSEILTFCGPGEYNALWKPRTQTHKKQNGKTLYIASDAENLEIVKDVAKKYSTVLDFLLLEDLPKSNVGLENFEKEVQNVDNILIGNLSPNYLTKSFLKNLFQDFPQKTFILFGNSIDLIDKSNFKNLENLTLVLNRTQLKKLTEKPLHNSVLEGSLRRFCIENKASAIMLGSKTLLYNKDGSFRFSYVRNIFDKAIDTKLASLVATYQTKNDSWLAMRAAVFTL